MRKLVEKKIDDAVVYQWFENNLPVGDPHASLKDAATWMEDRTSYDGPNRRFRPDDRRWDYDRRKRVSLIERRTIVPGRRYTDSLKRLKGA